MNVAEALAEIRRVGIVESSGGNLKLILPQAARSELEAEIDTLRSHKAEVLAMLAEPDRADLARASAVLKRGGVRMMQLDGAATIGVWSDLDGPKVRAALRAFGSDRLPIRYLDGAGIPMRYKLRRVEGAAVPMSVLAEMERRQGDPMEGRYPIEDRGPIENIYPWTVRDRLLNKMGWCSKGIAPAEWKASMLNRLLKGQDVTGNPGCITAATVRHGERKAGGNV